MSTLSIVGLIIIGLAAAHNKWEVMAFKNGYKTIGKVIDFQPSINSFDYGAQHTREYPIVEYLDEDGKMKYDEMSTPNSIGKYKLGDEIEVVKYEFKLHHRKINYHVTIVIAVIGIIISILGYLQ